MPTNFFSLASVGLTAYLQSQDGRSDRRAQSVAAERQARLDTLALNGRNRNIAIGLTAVTVIGLGIIVTRRAS